MSNLKEFWEEIRRFGIPKLSDFLIDQKTKELFYKQTRTRTTSNWEVSTPEYLTFSINVSRVAVFLNDIKIMEPNLDRSKPNASFEAKKLFLDYHIKCEAVIIFLVTTLEVYLESVYHIALNKLKINTIDPKYNFQNKEDCKTAFKIIGIDLPNVDNQLWQDIFAAKKEGSIMNLRHRIIHTGLKVFLSYDFTFEEIEEKVLNVIKFISKIETKRRDLKILSSQIVKIFDESLF